MPGDRVEERPERGEFPVHGDPQRLEHPRGRVDVPWPGPPGDRRGNQFREPGGRPDRVPFPALDHRAGDPPGKPLLPELEEDVREILLPRVPEDLRRRRPAAVRVPPHVEGTLHPERETARGVVELEGRDPQVEQGAVERLPTRGLTQRIEVREVRPDEPHPGERRESTGGDPEHRGVRVGADQKTPFADPGGDLRRMPSGSGRPVEEDLAGGRGHPFQRLM